MSKDRAIIKAIAKEYSGATIKPAEYSAGFIVEFRKERTMINKLFEYFILSLVLLVGLTTAWFSFGLDIWQEIQDSKWEKHILKDSTGIQDGVLTSQGNYLLIGSTKESNQKVIYKIDDAGKVLFKKYINEAVNQIFSTPEGNYLLLSNTTLLKINRTGKKLWQKRIKVETKNDDNIEYDEILSTQNGYLIAGSSAEEVFLLSVNKKGQIKQYKSYRSLNNVEDMIKTTDNNLLLLVSNLNSNLNVVLKLEQSGNILKKKKYEEYNNIYFHALQEVRKGKYLIAGMYKSSKQRKKGLLLKGNFENIDWQRDYKAGLGLDINLEEVSSTHDNNFLVIGSKDEGIRGGSNNLYLLKVTPEGEIIWEKSYGTQAYDKFTGLIKTEDGMLIMGYLAHPDDYPNTVGVIFKIDSRGEIVKDFQIK